MQLIMQVLYKDKHLAYLFAEVPDEIAMINWSESLSSDWLPPSAG